MDVPTAIAPYSELDKAVVAYLGLLNGWKRSSFLVRSVPDVIGGLTVNQGKSEGG
jgi:hypothetical protein